MVQLPDRSVRALPGAAFALLLGGLASATTSRPVAGQDPAAATGDRPAAGAGVEPTWADGIAALVHQNCTPCHRPNQVAPFSLITYEDARRRGRMLLRVTESGYMPPWHPAAGHGEFAGEARLSAEQLAQLRSWVAAGMPEGDPDQVPALPEFGDGWMLGEPDLVVEMPRGFEVPADGPDIYRNFVVPLGLDEDRWVTAIEVRPGARGVLHHIIFQLDSTGQARARDGADGQPGFGGMGGGGLGRSGIDNDGSVSTSGLGGWAVGGMPRHLPLGLARHVPKGADLVLNSHLHPSGKVEVERTTLGLYFADEPPERTMVGLQLPPAFGLAAGIDIPPGKADFVITDRITLPVAAQAVSVGGHAHMVCSSMQLWVTRPGAQKESLFYIPEWDFDWQNRYQYAAPVDLPAGTVVEVALTFDNSEANAQNPYQPPQRIRWGPQSTDEMGSITLLLVAARERDTKALEDAIAQHRRQSFRGESARTGIAAAIVSQLWMADKDSDDRLSREEIPRRWARIFDRADADGDGFLSRDEVDALADSMGGTGGRRRR